MLYNVHHQVVPYDLKLITDYTLHYQIQVPIHMAPNSNVLLENEPDRTFCHGKSEYNEISLGEVIKLKKKLHFELKNIYLGGFILFTWG